MATHRITEHRTRIIKESLTDAIGKGDVDFCSSYGEPGYADPDTAILFANWNNTFSQSIQNYLEELGYTLEWSDEWYIDHDNDKAWRTFPDGWHWIPQIRFFDGFVLTPDDDVSDWIDACKSGNSYHDIIPIPSRITESELTEWEESLQRDGELIIERKEMSDTLKRLQTEHGSNLDYVLFREIKDTGHELSIHYLLSE